MDSRTRTFLFGMMFAATSACAGYVTAGGASLTFVDRAPPPARREVRTSSPGSGHVWVGGHWGWQGNDYVWVSGSWMAVEPSHRGGKPGWQHDRRGWYWVDGHWR